MKNRGITLVSLVVTIIVLIILAGVSLNLILGNNGIITMARKAKENMEFAQREEEAKLNELYAQMESGEGILGELNYDAIAKLNEFKKAIAEYIEEAGGIKPDFVADTVSFGESIKGILAEVTKDATATEENILEGKTAWIKGKKTTGTMKNNGELNGNLNCSQTYTIPAGYTSGGTIVANSLASQTKATAIADDIAEGKTAYVNGKLITGTSIGTVMAKTKWVKLDSGTFFKGTSSNKTYSVDKEKCLGAFGAISPNVNWIILLAKPSGSTITFNFQDYFGDVSNNYGSYVCYALYVDD